MVGIVGTAAAGGGSAEMVGTIGGSNGTTKPFQQSFLIAGLS